MAALWIIGATACALTALLGLASAISRILLARRRGRWQSSPGTVTGHGSRTDSTGPPSYYPVTTRYAIAGYIDPKGRGHTLRVSDRPYGYTVPILFNPRHPGDACEDQTFGPDSFPVFLAIAALIGLLLFLFPVGIG
jgi:hypothetical protein